MEQRTAPLADLDVQLLRLLARGRTGQDLARGARLDPKVARRRVARIREALGAETDIHAVAIAVRRGII
jgi:DNA-binding CsgD family transcriptional regulator